MSKYILYISVVSMTYKYILHVLSTQFNTFTVHQIHTTIPTYLSIR